MQQQPIIVEGKSMRSRLEIIADSNGSIIVVALLVLLLMSIVGLSATSTSVSESFIIRNAGIYRQNLNLVEAAAFEVTQDAVLVLTDPERLSVDHPSRVDYVIAVAEWTAGSPSKNDDWYDPASLGRVLDGDGTAFPQYRVPTFLDDVTMIDDVRAEGNDPLRVALVGWAPSRRGSIKQFASQAVRLEGRVMAEYASADYGVTRLEVGIEREFK